MENEEIKNNEEVTEEVTENVEEASEETKETTIEEVKSTEVPQGNDKKNSNGKTIAIILIVVALLAGVLYFVYTKISNPKQLFVNSINKNYEQLENLFDDTKSNTKLSDSKPSVVEESLSMKLDVDKSLIDNDTKKIIDEVNKLKVNAKVGVNPKNKEGFVNLGALYDNDSLINLGAYLKDNKAYIELKDLYNKIIEVPLDELDIDIDQAKMNYDTEDIKYIVRTSKDAVLNSLDGKDFKKSKATIKIDGNEVKTTRISYELNQKDANELSKKALKELVKDKKYIKTLSKLSGEKEDKIKESLEETIKNLEDVKDFDSKTTMTLNAYVKGLKNENVGFDIVAKNEDETVKLAYYKNSDVKEFSLVGGDKLSLTVKSTDKKIKVNVKAEDTELKINVDKKEEKNKTTYDYTISSQGMSITGSVIIDVKENTEDKYEAKITSSASMMGMVKATVTVDINAKTVKSLDFPSLNNSISYDKLTEEDMNNISTKLMQNKALQKLITNFGGNQLLY